MKFNRNKGAAPAAKANTGSTKRKGRWAGVKASAPKIPIIPAGDYVLRAVSVEQGFNEGKGTESVKALFEVVESDGPEAMQPGEQGMAIFLISGKSMLMGKGRTKAMFVALAGCDDEDAFDEADPDGESIDEAIDAVGFGEFTDTLVDVRITRGNATESGDYFREYEWAPHE